MLTFKQFVDYLYEGVHDCDSDEEMHRRLSIEPSEVNSQNRDHKNHHDKIVAALKRMNSSNHGSDYVKSALEKWHRHPNSWIRVNVAKHPELDEHPEIKQTLLDDKVGRVASSAAEPRKGAKTASASKKTGSSKQSSKPALNNFNLMGSMSQSSGGSVSGSSSGPSWGGSSVNYNIKAAEPGEQTPKPSEQTPKPSKQTSGLKPAPAPKKKPKSEVVNDADYANVPGETSDQVRKRTHVTHKGKHIGTVETSKRGTTKVITSHGGMISEMPTPDHAEGIKTIRQWHSGGDQIDALDNPVARKKK